jgi:hypothetical protein
MPQRRPALAPRAHELTDAAVLYMPALAALLVVVSIQILIRQFVFVHLLAWSALLLPLGTLIAAAAFVIWSLLQAADYRRLCALASRGESGAPRFLDDAPHQFYYADGRLTRQAAICLAGTLGILLHGAPLWLDGRVPGNMAAFLAVWIGFAVSCGSAGVRFIVLRLSSQPLLEIGRQGIRFLQGYRQPLEVPWAEIDAIALAGNRSGHDVGFPTADIYLNEAALARRLARPEPGKPYRSVKISWLEGGMEVFLEVVEHFRADHVRIVDARGADPKRGRPSDS